MTTTTNRTMTLEEYLNYDDGTDTRYEVEVVSSSDTNQQSRERDYGDKRQEYAQRGILKYWIIDPVEVVILVLKLIDGEYQEQRFIGDDGDNIASVSRLKT